MQMRTGVLPAVTQRFDAFERIGTATTAEIAEAQKLAPNKQPPL
jgi:hypothetical protein